MQNDIKLKTYGGGGSWYPPPTENLCFAEKVPVV